jgi:chromate transporter
MSDQANIDPAFAAPPAVPTLPEVFVAFAKCSVAGFGGVLPWARRMIVERKRWMTAQEFNETFSLSQFLPGPNIVNFSVVFGSRFGGAAGAAAALTGLLGPPFVIVTVMAILYSFYGDVAAVSRILAGISSAAVGLLISTVVKMGMPVFRRGLHWAPLFALVAFVAVGPLHWPLQWVFLVLAPLSVAAAWWRR